MILHFDITMLMEGPAGELVFERRCREHPRLWILQQRREFSEPIVTTFSIEGVANYFHSIDDALDALRANPRPGDIVSVPPRPFPEPELAL